MGYLPQGNIFHWPMPVEAIVGPRPLSAWRSVRRADRRRQSRDQGRARRHRDGKIRAARGHDIVRRRTRARRARPRARDAGADPAGRRADGVARRAASARRDGIAAQGRPSRRERARGHPRSLARRALCGSRADHGERTHRRARHARARRSIRRALPRCSAWRRRCCPSTARSIPVARGRFETIRAAARATTGCGCATSSTSEFRKLQADGRGAAVLHAMRDQSATAPTVTVSPGSVGRNNRFLK